MPRVFVPSIPKNAPVVTITGEEARYARLVLRAREGDAYTLIDEGGRRHLATVTACTQSGVVFRVLEPVPAPPEPAVSVVLAQAMLKGQKMDIVVQKAVELGVRALVPLITERTLVRETRRVLRWRKIAREAARQCGRAVAPNVAEPATLAEYLSSPGRPPHGIVFTEEGGMSLEVALPRSFTGDVLALVGPEGGLSHEDLRLAREAGLRAATLGDLVLRAETASIVTVALLQYRIGNLAPSSR
jgi:16S rRNA (uracil1498-N3)-methyltransferase